jgi:predicted MPP superfamily phosphohydrolase
MLMAREASAGADRGSGASVGYRGVLFIGDPHLEGRQPGFRKDDYPQVILKKLAWCLNYAEEHRLLPAFLGDVFDKPRDNPTWMIARLIDMLAGRECVGIYGNHDCADPELNDNDSLMLLFKSGSIRLVSEGDPWHGVMGGRRVMIGGSSYREQLPQAPAGAAARPTGDADAADSVTAGRAAGRAARPLGIWLSHHDIIAPGYEEQGRVRPREIPGVDLVVNGHIHRELGEVEVGATRWVTPGNISRRSRSDAVRDHVPSVLRLDVRAGEYELTRVEVPHAPFDEVFHPLVAGEETDTSASAFVSGLAELQARRTQSGAGLMSFLDQNLDQFEEAVAAEIRSLAEEVTGYGDG